MVRLHPDLKTRAINQLRGNGYTVNTDAISQIDNLMLHQMELDIQHDDLLEIQELLADSLEKYRSLYQFVPLAFFTLNQNGFITESNEKGANLLGLPKERLVNQNFSRYVSPEHYIKYLQHKENILKNNKSEKCEIKLLQRNGPIFLAQIESRILYKKLNNEVTILTTVSNITETRNNQSLLGQYSQIPLIDKNYSIDALLTSIVNSLNDPISIINNFIQGCILRIKNNNYNIEDIHEVLKKSIQQSERITDIILRMRNFNILNNLKCDKICINSLIKESIEYIRHEAANLNVEFFLHPLKNNLLIFIDKNYIQQAIINLARNAIDAMKEAQIENAKIKIECFQPNRNTIEISIVDNGPGLDSSQLEKLEGLNFTTKSYGIGLGLVMSRKIIESHGGKLTLKTNHPYGACAKILLPIESIE